MAGGDDAGAARHVAQHRDLAETWSAIDLRRLNVWQVLRRNVRNSLRRSNSGITRKAKSFSMIS